MAWFKGSPPPPPNRDQPVNDYGFVAPKAKKYHCSCGYETSASMAMDSHVRSEHPEG